MNINTTTIDCTVQRETDKAMLIQVIENVSGKKLTTWIPKSKCTYDVKSSTVDIPDWLYEKIIFK